MRVDILLRTKDRNQDYKWVSCPEYVDEKMMSHLDFIPDMMKRGTLLEYHRKEAWKNIYYIHDAYGSMLVRCCCSSEKDAYGREIFATEGFCCSAYDNRDFWYHLPYLIDLLLTLPSLRDYCMGGKTMAEQEAGFWFDTKISEDSLLVAPSEEDSLWMNLREKNGQMRQLTGDILKADRMYSFVYGSREQDFYPGNWECFYSPEVNMALPVAEMKIPEPTKPVIPEEDHYYTIEINVEKDRRHYNLSLIARDRQGVALAETDTSLLHVMKGGIGLAQLETARRAVEATLAKDAYQRKG